MKTFNDFYNEREEEKKLAKELILKTMLDTFSKIIDEYFELKEEFVSEVIKDLRENKEFEKYKNRFLKE